MSTVPDAKKGFGLDVRYAAFNTCLDSDKYGTMITMKAKAGVTGTPTLFVKRSACERHATVRGDRKGD